MSRTFTSTSTLSTAPTTTASTRRGVAGSRAASGDDDEELEREPRERAEGEAARLVRRDERGPDEQQGEDRERHGDARAQRPACAARPRPARRRRHSHHVHSPIDAASRASAAARSDLRERPGQDLGGRDRQHDALRRRDDPAPAARRQRRAHPRQQPLAGEEQVARGPDREHPRAVRGGDVDAEGEDQERVDLAVEARAQRGRRPGAPRHRIRRPRPARARRRRASRAARPACRA